MKETSILERAIWLVNTSVDDMSSSLWNYQWRDLPILRRALEIVKRRGEKTKVKALTAKINMLIEKEQAKIPSHR